MVELSNYWDDFQQRINQTVDLLALGNLPTLERLTVHLTERCNFRCKYCNMDFNGRDLSQLNVYNIVQEYAHMDGNTIHFTGGEPSVVKNIATYCKEAKYHGLTVSSNTNAYKRMDVSNIDKLKCSFDTCDEVAFNEMVGCDDAFEKVVDNMKYYSKEMRGKMLSITAVLNKNTYKGMLDLAKFVHNEFDVYNLYFSNYKGNNPDFAFTDEMIEDMFENYIPKVLEYFESVGETYSYNQLALYKPQDFKNVDCRFEANKTVPCTIQLSEMTIAVDGSCHNCSHLYRDHVEPRVGANILFDNLEDCFVKLKLGLDGNYTYLSEKCLNGCNTNLIGFNKTVQLNHKI